MTKEELKELESSVLLPQYFVGDWLGRNIYYDPAKDFGVVIFSGSSVCDEMGSFEYLKNWINYGAVSMNKNPFNILQSLQTMKENAGLS